MANIDRLFELLKKRNISSNKLSISTGISSGNISDWKSKRSMPSAEKLCIISDYLDCSIDYLLGRTDVVEVNKGYSAHPPYGELAAQGGIDNQEPPKKKPEIL